MARPGNTARARRTGLGALRFYGEGFVFDSAWGMFYRISPTAAFVLRALQNGASRDELTELFAHQYGIDSARATRDIERFLNDLRGVGLLGGAA